MIRSFNLCSIEARRVPDLDLSGQEVRKDYKSNVSMIEAGGKKKARISFGFMVHYGNVGIIRMEGVIEYKGETKELLDTWDESNQMPDDISTEVHTAIMNGCITEAVMVARDIGLPPPIPLPRMARTKKSSK